MPKAEIFFASGGLFGTKYRLFQQIAKTFSPLLSCPKKDRQTNICAHLKNLKPAHCLKDSCNPVDSVCIHGELALTVGLYFVTDFMEIRGVVIYMSIIRVPRTWANDFTACGGTCCKCKPLC